MISENLIQFDTIFTCVHRYSTSLRVKTKHQKMRWEQTKREREIEAASLTHDIKRPGNELHFRLTDRPCVHESDFRFYPGEFKTGAPV